MERLLLLLSCCQQKRWTLAGTYTNSPQQKMPISRLSRSRVGISEPLLSEHISTLRADPEVRVIQAVEPLRPNSWIRLNEEIFAARPDIELRVFGHYDGDCDLRFVIGMTNVRRFAADSLHRAVHVEAVGAMSQLESLSIGVFDLESLDFLADVSDGLKKLFLHATRSKKPSLHLLARFRDLTVLYLEGQTKHIEVLSDLPCLREVTLRSVSVPDLSFLSGLPELWSVDLKLGGINDLSALTTLPSLKYLEAWQVRGLDDLSVLSDLPGLQNLFLQSLRRVESLPSFARNARLRRVVMQNMRGLQNVAPLEWAPALEEFCLLQGGNFAPADLLPVLRNVTLVSISASFGSQRRNAEFESTRKEYGKVPFDYWTPFRYA